VTAAYFEVSPDFLNTLGIRLLRGRDVAWTDTRSAPRVAVVNETFVRRVLPGGEALGRHFRRGPNGPLFTVIGEVTDGKYASLTEAPAPVVFEPMLQSYNTTTALLVKSSLPPEDVIASVRRVMAELDPQLPLFGVQSVDQMLGFALLPMRAASVSLGLFGLLAVALAATGLHGLIAYTVAQRRREIGIRVAIGATAGRVLRLVLSRIAVLVGIGTAVGIALTLVATPVLTNIVYQASPLDPLTLAAVMAIIVIVGVGSCGGPAWRSLRISPTLALRAE
jgi:putative ABC transport system permease protein